MLLNKVCLSVCLSEYSTKDRSFIKFLSIIPSPQPAVLSHSMTFRPWCYPASSSSVSFISASSLPFYPRSRPSTDCNDGISGLFTVSSGFLLFPRSLTLSKTSFLTFSVHLIFSRSSSLLIRQTSAFARPF